MKIELPSEDLIKFIPKSQFKVMMETPEAFEAEVKRLNAIVAKIPGLGETDNLPKHPLALHYFVGGCDWYIAEYDREEDIFFGYAILNNDYQNSEWGYIGRTEIISLEIPERHLMINLDLYCHEETIEDALFKKDNEYFWRYDPLFEDKKDN
ncbi:hypothetical protein FACS1894110_14060 [Spirochaetia bacterium]|nr:hypothetical protein FACS1894110_14060 [Spirochaetia bacterium]